MKKRTTGVVFICIAAFLYGIRYLSAAIFASNVSSWDANLFRDMLGYVGKGPLILSILSLIVGIIYILIAEFGQSMKETGTFNSNPLFDKIKKNWNEEK